ncbi:MAG: thioesterase family protein [Solirubrobacterales bacterium]|nr:thioesterase family protein [Solirubrobacterales bacterium]
MSEAVFTPDGDAFVPSGHARGPWDPDAMHGGGPAALLARAVERADAPGPMRVARLTVEFLKAVPLAPVTVHAEVVRGGRRLQLLEATLRADGEDVLRARAVRLRAGDEAVPAAAPERPVPGPEEAEHAPFPVAGEAQGFHRTAMDIRFVRGSFGESGPALTWFRLQRPLVAGEAPTPLQRAVAAADFGNGVSRVLDWDEHLFVNTDLSVHLHREPEGEWVALDARTDLDPAGIGQATSVLRDPRGRLGVAAQSLYVAAR